MISSMSNNTPVQSHERLSQFLPTVKCSTCLHPVPLTSLGEHTCAAPPPIPTSSTTMTTTERDWQSPRVASPAFSVRSTASSKNVQHASSPPRRDSSTSRLRIDTVTRVPPSPTHLTFKSSPLARTAEAAEGIERKSTSSPKPVPSLRDTHNLSSSPLRARIDSPSPASSQNNNNNNPGSALSTPSTARPPLSFNQEYTPTESGPQRARAQTGGPRQGQGMFLPQRAPGPQPKPHLQPNTTPPTNDVPFPRRPSAAGLHNNNAGLPPAPAGYPRRPGLPGLVSVPNAPPPPRINMMGGGSQQGGAPSPRLATTSFPPVRPDDNVKSGEAFIPPMERGIDTSSGGEAGMAGVGRRGFAAAARAAMFVAQAPRPMGPQLQPHYNRKQMAPHLDLDVPVQPATETPPLSAGSGYTSSHSPGPASPLPQQDAKFPQLLLQHRSQISSLGQLRDLSTSVPIKAPGTLTLPFPADGFNSIGSGSSPVSPRLPFFERYKKDFPSMGSAEKQTLPNDTNSFLPAANSIDHAMRTLLSQSSNSSASAGASLASKGRDIPADPPSSAESEYSGLAYANSTDDEDLRGRSLASPRGAPLKASILRSISNSKVQFGSVTGRSKSNESSKVRANAARSTLRTEAHSETNSRSHSRDNSVSSYSSNTGSEDGRRARSNSSAIAQALGLSQRPPSEYRKLGGPGVHNVEGRVGRSASGKNSSSQGGRSRAGTDEKERETTLTLKIMDAPKMVKQLSGSAASSSSGLSLALRERARDEAEESSVLNLNLNVATKPKAHRSNTVQGVVQVQSPDVKSVKLPVRSQSEREKPPGVGERKGDGLLRKEKAKKLKVCLKCMTIIENGRWVSTDGGGILCEKCWKNMYLPKCRRCNLPIEKQAVSSSDGQLKGKYHKECFNCHECHKPFPDKTFYVYDGKPLCAYHYHEANESLCAAARCGQPIEGPCAVSHTGDRYHPEHMTCEYPGSECGERLNEYWEVDGRMLCERHAVHGSKDEEEERWGSGKKGLKRVTRFIDLAGGSITSPANNQGENGGGDEDGGLR